jgi:hypothetical protein
LIAAAFIKMLVAAVTSIAVTVANLSFFSRLAEKRGKIAVFALAHGSAGLLDPEFAPAGRADFTVDQRARVRLLEQRAVAALLIALWGLLVFCDLLSHLGGSLSDRTK